MAMFEQGFSKIWPSGPVLNQTWPSLIPKRDVWKSIKPYWDLIEMNVLMIFHEDWMQMWPQMCWQEQVFDPNMTQFWTKLVESSDEPHINIWWKIGF